MGHNKTTNETSGYAPASLPDMFALLIFVFENDVEHLREVLTQVVAGARLERFTVTDQGFNRVCVYGTGKLLVLCLFCQE